MYHFQSIQAYSNPVLKQMRAVARGRESGLTLLEGRRLIGDAIVAGTRIETLVVLADREQELWDGSFRDWDLAGIDCFSTSKNNFEKLGSVKNPPPVLAIAQEPAFADWSALEGSPNPLVCVIAGISDPGNLGALARSAEAFGVQAIVQIGAGVSPWNPRALRGSMGSLLRLPVLREQTAESALAALKIQGFRSVTAATRGGTSPEEFDWSGPVALWISGETGLGPEVMQAMAGLTIPLAGGVESLNVTVASSLLMYQAGRVRKS